MMRLEGVLAHYPSQIFKTSMNVFFSWEGGTRVIKCLFILDWLLFQALRSAKCRGFFMGGFWVGGNEMNRA